MVGKPAEIAVMSRRRAARGAGLRGCSGPEWPAGHRFRPFCADPARSRCAAPASSRWAPMR